MARKSKRLNKRSNKGTYKRITKDKQKSQYDELLKDARELYKIIAASLKTLKMGNDKWQILKF